jgi:chloride channel protein, CIC family
MDNIRNIIFDIDHHENMTAELLMIKPAAVIQCTENLQQVLNKFEETNQWNLPVLDNTRYVGFISKSSLLTKYRAELVRSA